MVTLDSEYLALLCRIVGTENVLTDPAQLACYAYDATGVKSRPAAVVRPTTTDQTAAVLRSANERRIPVYPRGTGTGMSGGSIPSQGGIALDMSRMNRIIRIDKANAVAEVEPGVVLGDFQRAVEAEGLFYPPDPASADFCTMGGNIAECAGGLRCVKYGVTRDYVLALEVVLPSGEVINTGRQTHKCVTGYDLTRLFVGSEGTLGVVTRIVVKLIPLPKQIGTIAAIFGTDGEAIVAALEIAGAAPLPRAVEFMDSQCVEAVIKHRATAGSPRSRRSSGKKKGDESTHWRTLVSHHPTPRPGVAPAPQPPAGPCDELLRAAQSGSRTCAFVLVEYDGGRVDVEEAVADAKALLENRGARLARTADDAAAREDLWDIRRAIAPSLYACCAHKIGEDICVPRTALQTVLVQLRGIEAECEIPVAVFGHVGDGNLHVNMLLDATARADTARVDRATRRVLETSILNGGTLSGEHGIGLAKAACIPLEVRPRELEIMRSIKSVFDPNGIMNPGKVFPG
ncbi:MAG: FAD-linked oxidase C-terminal domain-containing protein [Planctomycetota bacterium]|nr:FAD-linked oxidase C-terminal domain-containing protein [Planctomycetota bacterium]